MSKDLYADDLISGAATVDEACTQRIQTCDALLSARMTLRKWRTNSRELRDSIPRDLQETTPLVVSSTGQAYSVALSRPIQRLDPADPFSYIHSSTEKTVLLRSSRHINYSPWVLRCLSTRCVPEKNSCRQLDSLYSPVCKVQGHFSQSTDHPQD